ncbi:hypothetical protein ACOSQ3_028884 [Xanthoceras sorbifolium]
MEEVKGKSPYNNYRTKQTRYEKENWFACVKFNGNLDGKIEVSNGVNRGTGNGKKDSGKVSSFGSEGESSKNFDVTSGFRFEILSENMEGIFEDSGRQKKSGPQLTREVVRVTKILSKKISINKALDKNASPGSPVCTKGANSIKGKMHAALRSDAEQFKELKTMMDEVDLVQQSQLNVEAAGTQVITQDVLAIYLIMNLSDKINKID